MPYFAANLTMMFNEAEFLDRFEAARNAGFDAVEYLFPYAFDAGDIASRLESLQLTQALFNLPPGDWDGGERGIAALPSRTGEYQDSVGMALEYAKATKCKTLHVMSGVIDDDVDPELMRATYIDNLKFAADAFHAEGITCAIEPLNNRDVPGYLISTVADAVSIVREVGRPNVGVQFDFYHVQITEGDLTRRFEAYLDDIVHVQIAGVPERHEPNSGEVNYIPLFAMMDRLGYDGFVGCEYKPRGNTLDGLSWLFD